MVNQELQRVWRGISRYLIDGVWRYPFEFDFDFRNMRLDYTDFKRFWYNQVSLLTHEEAFENYFVEFNGIIRPLFAMLPCGKCPACRLASANELSNRLTLEYLTWNRPIVFLSLTYAEHCKPSHGVCKSDVVKFIDRFRKAAQKRGFNDGWRIFYVSEYGTDPAFTRRPHYHMLIFNVDFDSLHQSYALFTEALSKSWTFGRTEWEFARSPRAMCCYVTKYVTKSVRLQDNVPEGQNPNFWRGPSKGGGLGIGMLEYIKENFDYVKDKDVCFKYSYVGQDGQLYAEQITMTVPKFLLDKICPPLSRHVKTKAVKLLREAFYSYTLIRLLGDRLGLDVKDHYSLPDPLEYYDAFSSFIPFSMIEEEVYKAKKTVSELGPITSFKDLRPGFIVTPALGKVPNDVVTNARLHNTDYAKTIRIFKLLERNVDVYMLTIQCLSNVLRNFHFSFGDYVALLSKKSDRFINMRPYMQELPETMYNYRYHKHIADTPFSVDLPYDGSEYYRDE